MKYIERFEWAAVVPRTWNFEVVGYCDSRNCGRLESSVG